MEYKRLVDKENSTVFAALHISRVHIGIGSRLWCVKHNIVILLD